MSDNDKNTKDVPNLPGDDREQRRFDEEEAKWAAAQTSGSRTLFSL